MAKKESKEKKENHFDEFRSLRGSYRDYVSVSQTSEGEDSRARVAKRESMLELIKNHKGSEYPISDGNSDGEIDLEFGQVLGVARSSVTNYFSGNLDDIIRDAPEKDIADPRRVVSYDPVEKGKYEEIGRAHKDLRSLAELIKKDPKKFESQIRKEAVEVYVSEKEKEIKEKIDNDSLLKHADKELKEAFVRTTVSTYGQLFLADSEKIKEYGDRIVNEKEENFKKLLKSNPDYARESLRATVKRLGDKSENAQELVYSIGESIEERKAA